MGPDDLEPCIEDIRLEIDRLRREEQLLRERYRSTTDDCCSSSALFSGSAKSNRIGFSTIPGSPQDDNELQDQQKPENIFPLSANPSADTIDQRPTTPIMDEQEHLVNSDDDDEQAPIAMDDGQTECKTTRIGERDNRKSVLADVQEEKLVIITTEINAKQKCLEMLENARKRSDLIRQRYEERLKSLSERIQLAEDEKQAAVTKLSKSEDG